MKYMHVLFVRFVLLAAALLAAGCTGDTGTVRIDEKDNGSVVAMAIDEQAIITLPEDPASGVTWKAAISDGLVIVDERTSPGTHEWTVEALETGTFSFRAYPLTPPQSALDDEGAFSVTLRVT